MATPTYDPIASTTLTLPALSVTFSSLDTIAAGYRDLVLVAEGSWASVNSSSSARIQVNSDTNYSNYPFVDMRGDGSSTSTYADLEYGLLGTSWGYGNPSPIWNFSVSIMDFSATDKHKSFLARVNDSSSVVGASAFRWASTSAITSIQIAAGISFASGSVFSLYGIAA